MAKIQTRVRGEVQPQGKASPRFEIVRHGEPLPEFALRPVRKPPVKRKRPPRSAAAEGAAHCPLCDGLITRFDMEIYERHERCAPCHETLLEIGLSGHHEA